MASAGPYASLQTDNHASTPPLSFYRPDALPAAQPIASKHWRQKLTASQLENASAKNMHEHTHWWTDHPETWCLCRIYWTVGGIEEECCTVLIQPIPLRNTARTEIIRGVLQTSPCPAQAWQSPAHAYPVPPTYSLQHNASVLYSLQHNASVLYSLQHTASVLYSLQHTASVFNSLQQSATHCISLIQSATQCLSLIQSATQCISLIQSSTHCISLIQSATVLYSLQHTASVSYSLQQSYTVCNTLQQSYTVCNTMPQCYTTTRSQTPPRLSTNLKKQTSTRFPEDCGRHYSQTPNRLYTVDSWFSDWRS